MLDIGLDELRARLGEKFTDDLYTREAHGRDENATPGQPPLAVVYAESVADIQTLLAWANETLTAVIAFARNIWASRSQPSILALLRAETISLLPRHKFGGTVIANLL